MSSSTVYFSSINLRIYESVTFYSAATSSHWMSTAVTSCNIQIHD